MNNASNMSIDAISLCAYAKINIHLQVFDKRSDGFHNLESIFQRISLADYLSVTRSDELHECIVESPFMALPADNTLTHIWGVFKKAAGIKSGIKVRLIKNVPAGSGLGAGSSDAASLLRAVNELFEVRFSDAELKRLALQAGSDVPFFLENAAGIVTGRGELFEPLKARADCFGLLIWPGVHSCTKDAYRLLDKWKERQSGETKEWGAQKLAEQYGAPLKTWRFVNDFQQALERCYPVIRQAALDLYEQGAYFVQMSGSGSAVFGLFEAEGRMFSAFQTLEKKWNWCKSFILLAP